MDPGKTQTTDASVPPMLARLADEIKQLDDESTKAQVFYERLSLHGELFSQEELCCVGQFRNQLHERRRLKASQLEAAIETYETKIICIQDRLRQRREMLEDLDQETLLLRSNKGLMEAFASGQAMLQTEMQEAQKEMAL